MSSRPLLFARVDPALKQRVKADADQRFEGNESFVVRAAVVTYLRLRDHFGPSFEAEMEKIVPASPNPSAKERVA